MVHMKKKQKQQDAPFEIRCAWCGTTIRKDPAKDSEQMCLICYARMLNEYFQKVRTRRGDGGREDNRAA
jgi:hypothetical protein